MKFNGLRIVLLASTVTACALAPGAAAPAAAQSKARAGGETALSEKELRAFVRAYVAYQRIRSNYAPVLEKAKDAQSKKQIEQEANAKVQQVLDSNGLSAERYNCILAAVNADAALRKKVLKQVEEQRAQS